MHLNRRLRYLFLSLLWVAALFSCRRVEIAEGFNPTPYDLEIPDNLSILEVPPENPLTVEGVELGRHLFFDTRLSLDNTQSCGSCHAQEYGFTDSGKRFSTGVDGFEGNMNSMALINLGYADEFFWNGRSRGMENQAREPVINPIEMHETWANVLYKLQPDTMYQSMFQAAFGTREITEEHAVMAIAQFERTLISGNSDYDRFYRGEPSNFTQMALDGNDVFFSERGDCFHCHTVDLLTDNKFHNNGLDSLHYGFNQGRYLVTNDTNDIGKFKTPTLRNVEVTGPYMHDGRFATLEEVVEHYNSGIRKSGTLDPKIKKPEGLGLTEYEKRALVAFLKSLTDTTFLKNPAFANPWE